MTDYYAGFDAEFPDYSTIKSMAKRFRCKSEDLIALARQNDPFYVGTPADLEQAQWFADLWKRFGYRRGVHIRRVHYQLLSQDPPVHLPNGKPYENTESCWGMLNQAAKAARYLNMVDPTAFDDRRNPGAVINAPEESDDPEVGVWQEEWSGIQLPPLPDLPVYTLSGIVPEQPYLLEVWCEKSTMNDVLVPLCERYQANLQVGVGELSITSVLAFVERIRELDKPARIFYVSDFDPAGQSMPVAVSRKIEYFVRKYDMDADVKLLPVVLTAQQVRDYQLPRTPIKETERRRDRFENRHGSGAVELDALEALHPGELRRILCEEIERYFDSSLAERTRQAEEGLRQWLRECQQDIVSRYATELTELQEEYDSICQDFESSVADCSQRVADLWVRISDDMANEAPEIGRECLPEPCDARELWDALYDSSRPYMEQLQAYKRFQGRDRTARKSRMASNTCTRGVSGNSGLTAKDLDTMLTVFLPRTGGRLEGSSGSESEVSE